MISTHEHMRDIAGLDNDQSAVVILPFEFQGKANPEGPAQPTVLESGYDYSVDAIWASIANPTDNPENFSKIRFNFQQTGERGNVLPHFLSLLGFLSTQGPGPVIKFERGIYRLYGGRSIELKLEYDAGLAGGAWDGANKDIVINLQCSLYDQKLLDAIKPRKR